MNMQGVEPSGGMHFCMTRKHCCPAAGNRLSSLPPNFGSALSSLLSLDLRFNNLASLPPTFNELSQLTSLRLAGNWKLGAGSVPSEQADPISAYLPAHMPSLAVLDLSGCNLKSLSFKSRSIVSASSSIQASFATALVGEQPAQVIGPALRELHLGSNELASVPACVRELRHLQLLSLDDCGLQSLPSWLREACPDLTHLNVSGSSISRLEAAALPSKLASLVMSSSNISSVPEDIVTLADSLTELVSSCTHDHAHSCLSCQTRHRSNMPHAVRCFHLHANPLFLVGLQWKEQVGLTTQVNCPLP
jgi:Leucine-rich repeat (LRR) protein